jgi:hypothetical protein
MAPLIDALVQDSRDISPAPAQADVTAGQVAPLTNAPAASDVASKPAPASEPPSGVTSSNAAPPLGSSTNVTARFVPDNIILKLGDETQPVRIEATGIDHRVNGFQIHLLHPTSVVIESISCLGPFEGAIGLGPAPLEDGTLVGCALLASADHTAGDVMELVLKRTTSGQAEVAIGEIDPIDDAFFSEFVWSGDEAGQQAIIGVEPLTVRE